mmetsp:Transcript_19258/g.68016  ORF Transcript_19258/g.68016 Transcript_19258/m.68016 type:complete len:362 (+) Transcript_19258:412-1497(+)
MRAARPWKPPRNGQVAPSRRGAAQEHRLHDAQPRNLAARVDGSARRVAATAAAASALQAATQRHAAHHLHAAMRNAAADAADTACAVAVAARARRSAPRRSRELGDERGSGRDAHEGRRRDQAVRGRAQPLHHGLRVQQLRHAAQRGERGAERSDAGGACRSLGVVGADVRRDGHDALRLHQRLQHLRQRHAIAHLALRVPRQLAASQFQLPRRARAASVLVRHLGHHGRHARAHPRQALECRHRSVLRRRRRVARLGAYAPQPPRDELGCHLLPQRPPRLVVLVDFGEVDAAQLLGDEAPRAAQPVAVVVAAPHVTIAIAIARARAGAVAHRIIAAGGSGGRAKRRRAKPDVAAASRPRP